MTMTTISVAEGTKDRLDERCKPDDMSWDEFFRAVEHLLDEERDPDVCWQEYLRSGLVLEARQAREA